DEPVSWWRRMLAPMLVRPAAPVAACAVVLVAAGLIVNYPAGAPPVDLHLAEGEVEQVETTLEDLEMLRQFDLTRAM
ncbi:MAG: hypothetical protein ACRD96_01280, partial [Bryobacteraceae bacterium]